MTSDPTPNDCDWSMPRPSPVVESDGPRQPSTSRLAHGRGIDRPLSVTVASGSEVPVAFSLPSIGAAIFDQQEGDRGVHSKTSRND